MCLLLKLDTYSLHCTLIVIIILWHSFFLFSLNEGKKTLPPFLFSCCIPLFFTKTIWYFVFIVWWVNGICFFRYVFGKFGSVGYFYYYYRYYATHARCVLYVSVFSKTISFSKSIVWLLVSFKPNMNKRHATHHRHSEYIPILYIYNSWFDPQQKKILF